MDYIYEELERQRLAMEALLQPVAARRADAPEEEETRCGANRRVTAAFPEAQRVAGRSGAEELAVTVPETRMLPQSGTALLRVEADGVSRAVERDARRYDGGYQTY